MQSLESCESLVSSATGHALSFYVGYIYFSVPLTLGVVIEVALANGMLTDRTQIEALSMLPQFGLAFHISGIADKICPGQIHSSYSLVCKFLCFLNLPTSIWSGLFLRFLLALCVWGQ